MRGALVPGEDPAMEIAIAHAMVRRASVAAAGPTLRVYRPSAAVVAFGRRDTRLAGFPKAVSAARSAGFNPVIRPQGGRAVAYSEQALVVDHVSSQPGPPNGLQDRFTAFGELWVGVLRAHGIDAQIGAVPGEYCPGDHSVNARGQVKLVGTAQRVVRNAWLFSAVAIVGDAERLRRVLTEVYGHLDLPFDATSVGSLGLEAPGLSTDRLEGAVIDAYDQRFALSPVDLTDDLLALARTMLNDHVVPDDGSVDPAAR